MVTVSVLKWLIDVGVRLSSMYTRVYSLSHHHVNLSVLISRWSMETYTSIILCKSSPHQSSSPPADNSLYLVKSNATMVELIKEDDKRKMKFLVVVMVVSRPLGKFNKHHGYSISIREKAASQPL